MAPPESPSGASTPRSFTNQTASTEDLLKFQTVGLVHLDDFRKRRAEVLEQKEREAQDRTYGILKAGSSDVSTPRAQDESDR
jgi:protein FAM50